MCSSGASYNNFIAFDVRCIPVENLYVHQLRPWADTSSRINADLLSHNEVSAAHFTHCVQRSPARLMHTIRQFGKSCCLLSTQTLMSQP